MRFSVVVVTAERDVYSFARDLLLFQLYGSVVRVCAEQCALILFLIILNPIDEVDSVLDHFCFWWATVEEIFRTLSFD